MKRHRWQILLGLALVAMSAALYLLHYAIFRDPHHIFIYMLGDLAFLPVEVLLVTMIIHELLSAREKRTMLEKLNMIIGAFFSEVGTQLLAVLSDADPRLDEVRADLIPTTDWSDADFARAGCQVATRELRVDVAKVDLAALRDLLVGERDFLVRLLENPNLLEHETFTELLWAVFHLTEELEAREELGAVTGADVEHVEGDIVRAYSLLVREWVQYMKHLKDNYPYLFSLAVRTNPFDREASPVVT